MNSLRNPLLGEDAPRAEDVRSSHGEILIAHPTGGGHVCSIVKLDNNGRAVAGARKSLV